MCAVLLSFTWTRKNDVIVMLDFCSNQGLRTQRKQIRGVENLEISRQTQRKYIFLLLCISATLIKAVIVADPMPFCHVVMSHPFTKENQKAAEYQKYQWLLEKCNKGLFFIALTGFYVIIHELLMHSEESSSDTQGSNDEQQEKKGARKGVFCRTQIPGLQYMSCTDVKINSFS